MITAVTAGTGWGIHVPRASLRPLEGEAVGGAAVQLAAHPADQVDLRRINLAVGAQHRVAHMHEVTAAENDVRGQRHVRKKAVAESREVIVLAIVSVCALSLA